MAKFCFPFYLLLFLMLGGRASYAQVTDCPTLLIPANGDTDVSIATNLEWEMSATATGYILTVGTSPGGNEILNALDVGDVLSYDFEDNLPLFQDIYLTITPYDDFGIAVTCSEVTFMTGGTSVPLCTEIINPTDGDVLVSTTANITWIRDFSATGYLMTVFEGDENGIRIIENFDVGNGTNYKPPDFKPRTQYFVTIIPYNENGPAVGCRPISFTTGDGPLLPDCSRLTFPTNGAVNIPGDTGISWAAIPNVDGYLLTVGTTPNGNDIIDNLDVGEALNYQLPQNLPEGQLIYVQIHPYKGTLIAAACPISTFTVSGPPTVDISGFIPQFFTPNNDGFNDTWSVSSSDDFEVEHVRVFDRYGKLITQFTSGQFWDGSLNGRNLPSGSYWYAIQVADATSIRGYLLLKR